MASAWFRGALIVFTTQLVWVLIILGESHLDGLIPLITAWMFLAMNIAGVAAFVTARRAPRYRLFLGLSMAPLHAALAVAVNLTIASTGTNVDLSGFYGNAGLFVMTLLYGALVAAIGTAAGMWMARRHADATVPAPTITTAAVLPEISVVPAVVMDNLPQIRSD